jgi:hypothetical protein
MTWSPSLNRFAPETYLANSGASDESEALWLCGRNQRGRIRFEAIAATPARLSWLQAKVDAKGGALWIHAAVIDWLNSPRRPGESYGDVILRPR